ncbi:MAG: metalloregulator ArsR/SmtB family transcription factor [Chloroflexi bacterium]|nr:metalloregulator ArsR/SmtB family transcription factor [Chloroflexota bacterium]
MRTVQRYKADFFKAMGHPLRLALLERLVDGPRSVSTLAADIALDLPNTSRHLAQLRTAGVIEAEREGTTTVYRLSDPGIGEILSAARHIMMRQLHLTQEMLKDLTDE